MYPRSTQFLLILNVSTVSSMILHGTPSLLEQPPSASILADDIYKKQRECESIIGKAVDKFVDCIGCSFPEADEKYQQCKKFLEEKKREYRENILDRIASYKSVFNMRLSNGKEVVLPIPLEDVFTQGADIVDFNIQEELCVANRICCNLVDILKFSNYDMEKDPKKYNEKFLQCTALIHELKLKYIHLNKIDKKELMKDLGLSVTCEGKMIMFGLPKGTSDPDESTSSKSLGSVPPKMKPTNDHSQDGKFSIKEQSEIHNPYRDSFDYVVTELKSLRESLQHA